MASFRESFLQIFCLWTEKGKTTSEIEPFEGESGYLLDGRHKASEVWRRHVGLQRCLVFPCLEDEETVGIGLRCIDIIVDAAGVAQRQFDKFFCQLDSLTAVFFGFGNQIAVESYHGGNIYGVMSPVVNRRRAYQSIDMRRTNWNNVG